MATTHKVVTLVLWLLLQAIMQQGVGALRITKRDFSVNERGVVWDNSYERPISSTNKEKRKVFVKRAWEGALELIESAWMRFLTTTLLELEKGHLTETEQVEINEADPGYALFFALDSSEDGRTTIHSVLDGLQDRANADPGENGRPGGAAYPLHDRHDGRIRINGTDIANYRSRDLCYEECYAYTWSGKHWNTTNMHICPEFYKLTRFDHLVRQVDSGDSLELLGLYNNPEYDGTDTLAMLHELSHIWWIGATNRVAPDSSSLLDETYGLTECAENAWECGPQRNNPEVTKNADSFAWYAEYGFWHEKGFVNLWPQWPDSPMDTPLKYP